MRHAVIRSSRVFAHLIAGAAIGLIPATLARASGPVERIAEVIPHPTDPNIIVARYGLPESNKGTGLLFSSDGGKTFKASCSEFIAEDMTLSSSESLYKSQVHMDGAGRLLATGFINEVFVGDATGCGFVQEPFEFTRGASFAADPNDPKATFMFAFRRNDTKMEPARAYILRRDADGKWADVAEVHKERAADESVYSADLIAAKLPSGALRMTVHYTIYKDGQVGDRLYVATSDDGGATFTSHPLTLEDEEARFRLIGFDPADPQRIIALEYGEARRDKLLLSSDGGKTFAPWAEVDQFSGITYGEGGKVFVTSSNDKIDGSAGGLFTAGKVGDPLTKIPDSVNLDCIKYRASDKKLFGCYLDKVGTVDPQSGVFTPSIRMLAIESLIECPGKDVRKSCEKQLNAGTSWCCVGHFPWTPFCGDYSFPGRSTPICGKQAQEYVCREIGECGNEGGVIVTADGGVAPDRSDAGASPRNDSGVSGGMRDGGVSRSDAGNASNRSDAAAEDDDGDDDSGSKGGDDGCSASSHGGGRDLTSTLGLLGLALVVRRMRRRTVR